MAVRRSIQIVIPGFFILASAIIVYHNLLSPKMKLLISNDLHGGQYASNIQDTSARKLETTGKAFSPKDEENDERIKKNINIDIERLDKNVQDLLSLYKQDTFSKFASDENPNQIVKTSEFAPRGPSSQSVSISKSTTQDHAETPKRLYFLKVHKAGSTTVANILLRNCLKNNLTVGINRLAKSGLSHLGWPLPFKATYLTNSNVDMIFFHSIYNRVELEKVLPKKEAVYVAIFRETTGHVESALSYYTAVEHTMKPGIRDPITRMKTYLKAPDTFYIIKNKNVQIPLKNQGLFDFGFTNNSAGASTLYVRNLVREFDLIMLLEYFDESLILLRDLMGWTTEDIIYTKINSKRERAQKSMLTAESRKIIRLFNYADWQAYLAFEKVLLQKIEDYGASKMKNEVEKLRSALDTKEQQCSHGPSNGGRVVRSPRGGELRTALKVDTPSRLRKLPEPTLQLEQHGLQIKEAPPAERGVHHRLPVPEQSPELAQPLGAHRRGLLAVNNQQFRVSPENRVKQQPAKRLKRFTISAGSRREPWLYYNSCEIMRTLPLEVANQLYMKDTYAHI